MSQFMRTGNFNPGSMGRSMGFSVSTHMSPSPMLIVEGMRRLGLNIRGLNQPLKQSIDEVMTGPDGAIARNFEAQGRPEKWAPLSERTQEDREAHGYNSTAPILIRSGRLYRAAIAKSRWQYRSSGRQGMAFVGSFPRTIPYAASMHFGHRPHKIPARPYMVITEEDAARIHSNFDSWVGAKVAQSFGGRR